MATILPFRPSDHRRDHPQTGYPGLFPYELGLTDAEIDALVSGNIAEWGTVLTIDVRLKPDDAARIPVLRWAIALLRAIAEVEPAKATAAGNLPAKLVRSLFAGEFADAEPDFIRVQREDDSRILSWVRALCQEGGLLLFDGKAFSLSTAAHAALEKGNWSVLYQALLETHLANPQIVARFDRYDDEGAIAAVVPLFLYAMLAPDQECYFEEDFAWLMDAVGLADHFHWLDLLPVLRLRFAERFAEPFGLIQIDPRFHPPWEDDEPGYSQFGAPFRPTERFTRVFRHKKDAPLCTTLSPIAAALRIVDVIAEDDGPPPLFEEWRFHADLCARAIERCAECAVAYVVLTRVFDHEPQRALRCAEIGVAATAGCTPDVPDGVSPWDDYLFRDVLRIRFLRAETLRTLGRFEESVAAFQELLTDDPTDAVAALEYLVLALLQAGRFEEAHALPPVPHVREGFAAVHWNRVLTSFAVGDHAAAEALFATSMHVNPHVPEMLTARNPPDPPDFFTPGDAAEAAIYAEFAGTTWRSVPRAMDWLRRRMRRGR